MRNTLISGAVGVVLAAAVIVGCSNTPAAEPGGPSATGTFTAPLAGSPPVAAEHNAADVAFVHDMIPHHLQAIAMSSQAPQRAASPQVEDLARRIDQGQAPEIEQMNAMLDTWGAPRPQPASMPRSGIPMSGMMSDQQMSQLAMLSGPAFDRTFLTMMTAHHQGAITMAQTELATGQNPQVKQLAQAIITAQQAEISEMATLLRQA